MTAPPSVASWPTKRRVTAGLLLLSAVLYVTSLTQDVARVTGNVTLDAAGIERELKAHVGGDAALDKVSAEITAVITGVVQEEFPLFANQFVLDRIESGVDQQVRRRGPTVIDGLIPALEVPQPQPEIRRMRLLRTIRDLWNEHDRFLAACLFMFTIFFPVSKYVALTSLLFAAERSRLHLGTLRWLKNWGQWSMGDVFVVALLVVCLRINSSVISTGRLADIAVRIDVERGMYLFAASVLLAMVCSMALTTDES